MKPAQEAIIYNGGGGIYLHELCNITNSYQDEVNVNK